MSNTIQRFRAFQKLASEDQINPKVLLVGGAQGRQLADCTADPSENYGKGVDQRLDDAARKQIQVIWLKNATPRSEAPFSREAVELKMHRVVNIHVLKDRFPNLEMFYLGNRIYAGYAESPLKSGVSRI
ncbi:MAG: hypothetical protein VX910_05280 [Candidatus Latescibacterota bacterium]|nr:hypothetical protein [Candidatus Latescibacterota bacterium]